MDEGGNKRGKRRGKGRGRGPDKPPQGSEGDGGGLPQPRDAPGGDSVWGQPRDAPGGDSVWGQPRDAPGGDSVWGQPRAQRGWHQARPLTQTLRGPRPRSETPPQHAWGQPRVWGQQQAPSPVRAKAWGHPHPRSAPPHISRGQQRAQFPFQEQSLQRPQTSQDAALPTAAPSDLQRERPQELESGGKWKTAKGKKGKKGKMEEVTEAVGAMAVQEKTGTEKTKQLESQHELKVVKTRPDIVKDKAGTSGSSVKLVANYFPLKAEGHLSLCLYHVDFSFDDERSRERKKLLRVHEKLLGVNYIFDGMQLYLVGRLRKEVTELISKKESSGEIVNIKITFVKELGPLDVQFTHLLNVLMKRCQDYLELKELGRNYYDSKAGTEEPEYNITVWPGYSASIRNYENTLMLNVDITHKFLRKETALEVLNKRRGSIIPSGTVVMTCYNERTYRIEEVDRNKSPLSKFPYKGRQISYIDYYKQKYNLEIRDPKQPMLMSKPKKRDVRRGMTENIYLVPELSIMTGLSDEMRSDFNMMKNLAQYMRMSPDRRVAAIKEFNSRLQKNEKVKAEMKLWELKIGKDLVEVTGRVLPEESVKQGGREFFYNRKFSDWSRDSRSMKMNNPSHLVNWVFLYPMGQQNDAQDLVLALQKVAAPIGMNINKPQMMTFDERDVNQTLNTCVGRQLVMVLLRNNRGNLYSLVKKKLCTEMAIPSQCVLSRTIFKKQRLHSVATKIAIQMNCKLGGDVWNLAMPLQQFMVVGYDAYHDTINKGSSYGAVISSLNKCCTQYLGLVAQHRNREELTDRFSSAVKVSLLKFFQFNKSYPYRVIVYRDGVGEGQIGYVYEHEVASIRSTINKISPEIKLTFILVSKRINTRLFMKSGNDVANPPPGTVVDTVVTMPERYDFFMVPQSVNQGTVTPTSFNIISDSSGLSPDLLQKITYKLCHLYYNWQGAIRVPAPCMYAHKLAYITGTALHDLPHRDLSAKLWYL